MPLQPLPRTMGLLGHDKALSSTIAPIRLNNALPALIRRIVPNKALPRIIVPIVRSNALPTLIRSITADKRLSAPTGTYGAQ